MNFKHGLGTKHRHPAYSAWKNMRTRCTYKADKSFINYGGRGIRVCNKWQKSFKAFWIDMEPTWQKGLTLDRIDVNGNYYKENCRWVTSLIQNRNKRNTVWFEFEGETKSMKEWCEILSLDYQTVWQRVNRLGWSSTKAFNL